MDITVTKHADNKAPKHYRGTVDVVMSKDNPKVDVLVGTGCRKIDVLGDYVTLRFAFDSRTQLVDACNRFFRVGGIDIDHQKITIADAGDRVKVQQMLEKAHAGKYDNRPISI